MRPRPPPPACSRSTRRCSPRQPRRCRSGTADVDDLDAATEAARVGFARLPWAACGPDGERRLNGAGLSVRCLTTADGSVPATADADDLYAIIARAY